MTTKIVTGYTGSAHITAQDVQFLLEGVVSCKSYVFDQGKFTATLDSANKVTIGTGDAIMKGGCHVRVTEPESVTIESGTQGTNRNDLIALRYSKDASNVESCKLVVIKGTPTSGTAADPAYNDGSICYGQKATVDFPLYRVRLTGVNVAAPEQLFRTLERVDCLSEWSEYDGDVPNDPDGPFTCRALRRNSWVFLKVESSNTYGVDSSGYRTVATLPELYRPPFEIKTAGVALSESSTPNIACIVRTNGEVAVWASESTRYWAFSVTYPCDNFSN